MRPMREVLPNPDQAHGAQGEGEAADLPSCILDGRCPTLCWTLERWTCSEDPNARRKLNECSLNFQY